MSKKSQIPLSIPCIKGNEWKYVKECIESGWLSSAGKYVEMFEEKVAGYLGSKYAVSIINGTAALHISLILCGVSKDDEVIVPTVTFISPVNAVRYVGASQVFMDCDEYLNIDVQKTKEFIEKKCFFKNKKLINKTTNRIIKAILPVHVFGHPVDIEPLIALAEKYNLRIIEDATESLGSFYKKGRYSGKMTGTIGDIGCYSFNGNKIITTGGGGMLVTNNKKFAERARYLTTQAKDDAVRYIHNEIGYNYRLSNVSAAIGLAQMEKLGEKIKIKRENFLFYINNIKDINGLNMIFEPHYAASNYWFYSLLVDKNIYGIDNLGLMNILKSQHIQTRPLWYLCHKQKPYKNYQSYKIEQAEKSFNLLLNIPCSVNLSKNEIRKICRILKINAKN